MTLVEALDGAEHVERRVDRMSRVRIGCHHRIPDRFDDRPTMAHGCLAQKIEMLLDELEGIQVADTLIERRRPPDVGEQESNVADRQALCTTDHLGAEQASERLAGEQVLARQI